MREKHVHRLVARSAVQEKPALGYVFYVFVEMIERFDGYFHPRMMKSSFDMRKVMTASILCQEDSRLW